ncbi:hypothetical protein GALMADRAFT_746770 [Galerina marginata CBS 339.88]|uniref:Uncharacterized protein n=1 Tax=Galerina marginata (strain CBS 339.88) TaxID=685588 RepID=A0A067T214_GALM3|nr:hypothetical protein GALMADRAFT_746770 [Galerina marginata CBS 339.88]
MTMTQVWQIKSSQQNSPIDASLLVTRIDNAQQSYMQSRTPQAQLNPPTPVLVLAHRASAYSLSKNPTCPNHHRATPLSRDPLAEQLEEPKPTPSAHPGKRKPQIFKSNRNDTDRST